MRKRLISLAGFIALVAIGWWLLQEPASSRDATTSAVASSTPTAPPAAPPDAPPTARAGSKSSRVTDEATARAVMRQRILDAQHARERATRDDEDRASQRGNRPGPRPPATGGPQEPEDPPPVGDLVDRTGDHEYLVRVMNEDLMPLVDECIDQARELQPQLDGMLVVELEIIAEPEIGGVVESVDMGRDNEIVAPELTECVRESILATTLPPPTQGGRDEISISLPLTPNDDPAEPSPVDPTG